MSKPKKEDRVRLIEQLNDLAKGWEDEGLPDASEFDGSRLSEEEPPRSPAVGLSSARKRAIVEYLARKDAELERGDDT